MCLISYISIKIWIKGSRIYIKYHRLKIYRQQIFLWTHFHMCYRCRPQVLLYTVFSIQVSGHLSKAWSSLPMMPSIINFEHFIFPGSITFLILRKHVRSIGLETQISANELLSIIHFLCLMIYWATKNKYEFIKMRNIILLTTKYIFIGGLKIYFDNVKYYYDFVICDIIFSVNYN